jgi:Domain of unknown function (DUF4129)
LGASDWRILFNVDKISLVNKITPRTWTFIFAGVALLALILLSVSLNSMQMAAGKPFPFTELAPNIVDQSISSNWLRILLAIFRVGVIIGWILLPLYIIFLIVSKEERKRFLQRILTLIPIFLLLYLITKSQTVEKVASQLNPNLFGTPAVGQAQGTPVPTPQFTPPPNWVTSAAVVTISLSVTIVLGIVFFSMWRRAQARARLREPLENVEREAQIALDAIAAGGDLRDAILHCYLQMVETIKKYRGFYRDQDMTPREFEVFLEKRGMPGDPVHQLTRLFEEVRYGNLKPGRKEEQVAIASLSAIVSACQRFAKKQELNNERL